MRLRSDDLGGRKEEKEGRKEGRKGQAKDANNSKLFCRLHTEAYRFPDMIG